MDKENLIHETSEKVQALIHELEEKIEEPILSSTIYHGDIAKDGEETEGTKIILSTDEPEPELNFDEDSEPTVQDMLREYHEKENVLKQMIVNSTGLDHITEKYLEIIELGKRRG